MAPVEEMDPATEAIEDRLIRFICAELTPPETDVGPDDDLLAGDLLDSIAVLRLATFVAEEFAFEIRPADFVIENFRSVTVIGRYVRRAIGRAG